MQHTKIEWVRNPDGTQGYTWNPLTGCLNHVDGMCKGGNFPCYAYRLAHGRLKQRYLANVNGCLRLEPEGAVELGEYMKPLSDPFYPRFWPERLREPIPVYQRYGANRFLSTMQTPKGIFVCDMSDLFGLGVPVEWTKKVLSAIRESELHRFYLLTKQPQNLLRFSPFPENCYVGVTATNADMLFDALNHLDDIQCSVRYVSIEPMLGDCHLVDLPAHLGSTLDWLIIGAQTRPTVYLRIEWVQEIVEAAGKAGVPVFLKDNLSPILPIGYMFSMPGNKGVLRQEFPNG